jgi:hypothetical protein
VSWRRPSGWTASSAVVVSPSHPQQSNPLGGRPTLGPPQVALCLASLASCCHSRAEQAGPRVLSLPGSPSLFCLDSHLKSLSILSLLFCYASRYSASPSCSKTHQFSLSSISLPRFRVSLSSYFSWSNPTRPRCVQSLKLQTFCTSPSLHPTTWTRFPSAYPVRKPWPFIPIMSDSEDDKPLIKGKSMQLLVQLFALQSILPLWTRLTSK